MARRKTVEIGRGALTGSGANITEARADLNAQIDSALTGAYTPYLVTHGNHTAVVYREPDGWHYRLAHDAARRDGVHPIGYGTQYGTRDECIQHAAFHVIQNGAAREELFSDADIPDWLTDQNLRSTLVSTFRFYRAAHHAESVGITDSNERHQWACHHSNDPQFVNRPMATVCGGSRAASRRHSGSNPN